LVFKNNNLSTVITTSIQYCMTLFYFTEVW